MLIAGPQRHNAPTTPTSHAVLIIPVIRAIARAARPHRSGGQRRGNVMQTAQVQASGRRISQGGIEAQQHRGMEEESGNQGEQALSLASDAIVPVLFRAPILDCALLSYRDTLCRLRKNHAREGTSEKTIPEQNEMSTLASTCTAIVLAVSQLTTCRVSRVARPGNPMVWMEASNKGPGGREALPGGGGTGRRRGEHTGRPRAAARCAQIPCTAGRAPGGG